MDNTKFKIVMPYRPCCHGDFSSPGGDLVQLDDGSWRNDTGVIFKEGLEYEKHRVSIRQAIEALNRNSFYKHHIIVAMDADVYPNKAFLKNFENVSIVKAEIKVPQEHYGTRMSIACKHVFDSLSGEEFFCHVYLADSICSKDWDKYIVEAIDRFGEDKVYVPIWVEGSHGSFQELIGVELTPDFIWKECSKKIAGGMFFLPDPRKDYIQEEDFEHYTEVLKKGNRDCIIENCGGRFFGFLVSMCMKISYAKQVKFDISDHHSIDTGFDSQLGKMGLKKVVVTNSFIWHPQCPHLELRLKR
jgi:hypothetical protein